jgi:hypothetical protein
MKCKIFFFAILVLTFLLIHTFHSPAEIKRYYMNWGAISGNATWDINDGQATSVNIVDNRLKISCDRTQALCCTIGQDPDKGKWYVDVDEGGIYQPADRSYLITFDYENNEPVITPLGPIDPILNGNED